MWAAGWDSVLEVTSNISTYLDCFELEKFEPVDSEELLSKRGLELLETNQLWGGLVSARDRLSPRYVFEAVTTDFWLEFKLPLRFLSGSLQVNRSCQSLSPTRSALMRTRYNYHQTGSPPDFRSLLGMGWGT